MEFQIGHSLLRLVQGDITKQSTDAIVNAANSQLAHGGGVARAIASAAGPALEKESRDAPEVPTGQVYTTTAGDLDASYVIHAVGPVWHGGDQEEKQLLSSCIGQALTEADKLECTSISFPAISTGIFGYPLDQAAHTILSTTIKYLYQSETALEEVRMVLFADQDFQVFSSVLRDLMESV